MLLSQTKAKVKVKLVQKTQLTKALSTAHIVFLCYAFTFLINGEKIHLPV